MRHAYQALLKSDPVAAAKLEPELAKFEQQPPYEAEVVWKIYCDLSGDRDALVGAKGAVPKRLTFQDIAAWCQVHQAKLSSWETRALRELDDLFLSMQPTQA